MSANKNHHLNDCFPKSIKNATSTNDGLMSSEDKSRLDSVFEYGILTPATPDKDGIMTKEDKIKLDGVEEGANKYIHPDNENIRHITDNQINKWNDQIKYNNNNPTPIAIGGIEKGTTFSDMDYSVLITKLLYPYLDPSISNIIITPGTTILEKGSSFNLTKIQFNINTPSLQSTESIHYDFKMNNTKFHSIDTVNRSVNTTVNTGINDSTSITVTVIDNINKKEKTFTLINYTYIYPFYYGSINESDDINQILVKSKTKILQTKGNKTLKFNTNNQKMLFAYPKTYGALKTIYDANNFNVIGTFKFQEINIIANDGQTIPYYVYINDLSTVSNYNMQFVF